MSRVVNQLTKKTTIFREPTVLQILRADGLGLQVAFLKHGDRFHHSVSLIDHQQSIPLLESTEGTDEEIWPPSPPLQELSVEQHGEATVALLVGMAGKSHWSASVEVAADRPRVLFDIACLVRGSPQNLGSAYHLQLEPIAVDTRRLRFRPATDVLADLVLEPIGDEPTGPIRREGSELMICCTREPKTTQPTVRWKYALELIANGC